MALDYQTARLRVSEKTESVEQSELAELLIAIPRILKPAVVENLPPHFHGINSQADALYWLQRMVAESRLCLVSHDERDLLIGFLFTSAENDCDAHIGYLLREEYWGQGLASELLAGLIDHATNCESWMRLMGGVDRNNIASAGLLSKLGFVETANGNDQAQFYEYLLSSSSR